MPVRNSGTRSVGRRRRRAPGHDGRRRAAAVDAPGTGGGASCVTALAARVAVEELEVWVSRGAIWAGRCVRGLHETPGVPS
jgi:hypothetical protein